MVMLNRFTKTSLWQSLKNYLNEELDNSDQNHNEKKRKDILIGLEEKLMTLSPFISFGEFQTQRYKFSSVDCYLNYLHKAGYLYKPRYGVYGLAREIECDLSISDVINLAYGDPKIVSNLTGYQEEQNFFTEEEFDI